MKYSITKSGTVRVKASKDSACGSARSGKRFDWKVTIQTASLDGRGFVVEHIDITDAIDKFFINNVVNASCEQVASIIGWLTERAMGRSSYLVVELTGFATLRVEGASDDFVDWFTAVGGAKKLTVPRVNKPAEVTRINRSC